ncbi:GntR family transcriptional regulator [Kitasatospora sp. NBC_00240]|uniref:GntR family transcriptional regulator n=1 Tax=Kitasatospora sp. NBC_00240 TaxID=2903567 RepID=UPI00225B7EB8|nr:GntR family transcriptional regulator [Kitasatospora sp. NBC_00240]MCX5214712.1 GntR family transcriptional regulator [Kitasatospora sp. NBC_00240]
MSNALTHSGGFRPGSLPSRTEAVLDAIKHSILIGELKPGQPLVETELAARLGVSKTPVREALKTLAGTGLVTMSPYRGATVREVDEAMARSVYDMRLLLEPVAAARTAAVVRPSWAEAEAALDHADRAVDAAERSLANRDFHRALYAGCGNPLLVGSLDELRDQTALVSSAAWAVRPSWETEAQEHRAILEAARSGNPELVGDLLRDHIGAFIARNFPEN